MVEQDGIYWAGILLLFVFLILCVIFWLIFIKKAYWNRYCKKKQGGKKKKKLDKRVTLYSLVGITSYILTVLNLLIASIVTKSESDQVNWWGINYALTSLFWGIGQFTTYAVFIRRIYVTFRYTTFRYTYVTFLCY